MPKTYTAEQILALAPDAAAAQAGKGLATARKWQTLGRDDRSVWGECQGSGAKPYQTRLDLDEPAFKCSCPSRKFPCKHALGLFLLFADQSSLFKEAAPPAWVAEWLASRDQREQKQAEKQAEKAARPVDEAAQAKRAASRDAKVETGLRDLDLWLHDLIRNGLATAATQPLNFWLNPAARLVDAQAPGLARRVRDLATLPASGEGWQDRLLQRLSQIHLLIESYRRLEALAPEMQAEVRTQIGWTQDQDQVLNAAGVRDQWWVLGQRVQEEDRLRVQRTWLWGQTTAWPALILNFAYGAQPFSEMSLMPATTIDATLAYFPAAFALRALIKDQPVMVDSHAAPLGFATLADAFAAYAEALIRNPWLDRYPFTLQNVWPIQRNDFWYLRDQVGHTISLSPYSVQGWTLFALSGGQPITVSGEWNGEALWPLSVWANDRFVQVSE